MKSRFLTRLRVDLEDDNTWTLALPLVYRSDLTGKTYTVPEGFNTDIDSVPRLPVFYMLAKGRTITEAVLHDYLYRTGEEDRSTADAIYKEAMTVRHVGSAMKHMIWLGVRIGGRRHHVGTTTKPENVAPADESAKNVSD